MPTKKAEAAEAKEVKVEMDEKEAQAPAKKTAVKKPAAKKVAPKVAEPAADKKPAAKKAPVKKAAPKPSPKKVATRVAPKTAAAKKVVVKKNIVEVPKSEVSYAATGRRKDAVARVRLIPGTGQVFCNRRDGVEFFGRKQLVDFALVPLKAVGQLETFDVVATLHGGGVSGQAGALRLGIARALLEVNIDYRADLKRAGLLKRDPRVVERKKYGLKKARKRPQFSKR
jgi:small subunit ribosomal protein S9